MTAYYEIMAGGRPDVLAVWIAVMLAPLLMLFHVALLRIFAERHALRLPVLSFLGYISACVAIHLRVAGAEGGLATPMLIIAALGTTWFLSYGQIFSLACRSFSLRILVDLKKSGPWSLEQLYRGYADGKGIDWLLQKRIAGLLALGVIALEGDRFVIAGRFWRVTARLLVAMRNLLGLGERSK